MARVSRKERKHQRQRVTNATERGLPTSQAETRNGRLGSVPLDYSENPVTTDISQSAPAATSRGFSSWSLPMKLLTIVAVTTLALLGFSLWKTLASGGHSP